MQRWKVAVMGGGGVGKSAVTIRFINGQYVETYDPTIEDSYSKTWMVDGQLTMLEVLDTAGIDQYLSLNDMYIRESDAFVLVFSLADSDTLAEVHSAHKAILRNHDKPMPIVIVGNKSDLEYEREVKWDEVAELAHEWGCTYIEASASNNINIDRVFDGIVRQLRKVHQGQLVQVKEKKKKWRSKCVFL